MTDIQVNNIALDAGCIVDGDVHGQYSVDKLADFAIAVGLPLTQDNDPRHWRSLINGPNLGDEMAVFYHEHLNDAGDALLELLNKHTQGGFFEWDDGSVYLVSDEDDDEHED